MLRRRSFRLAGRGPAFALVVVWASLLAAPAGAAPGDIGVVAGRNEGSCVAAAADASRDDPFADGTPATQIRFSNDSLSLSANSAGTQLFADRRSEAGATVVRITRTPGATPTVATVAGGGTNTGGDGPATAARLVEVKSLAVDPRGRNLYVQEKADQATPRILRVALAGNPSASTMETLAVAGTVPASDGMAVDNLGDIFLNTEGSGPVRKIDRSGTVTTGATSFTSSTLTVDASGQRIFLAEAKTGAIYRLDPASLGVAARFTPGLSSPGGVAVDPSGLRLFVSDTLNRRVVELDPENGSILQTVAGQTGAAGSAGDGGPGPRAFLRYPTAMAVDDQFDVVVYDRDNCVFRMIETVPAPSTAKSTDGQDSTVQPPAADNKQGAPVKADPPTGAKTSPTGPGTQTNPAGGGAQTNPAGGGQTSPGAGAARAGPGPAGAGGGVSRAEALAGPSGNNLGLPDWMFSSDPAAAFAKLFGGAQGGGVGAGGGGVGNVVGGMAPGPPPIAPGAVAGGLAPGVGPSALPPGASAVPAPVPVPHGQPGPGPGLAVAEGQGARAGARYAMVRQDGAGPALGWALAGGAAVTLMTCVLVAAAGGGRAAARGRARPRPKGAY